MRGQFLFSGPRDSGLVSADNRCPWVGWMPTRLHDRDGKISPYVFPGQVGSESVWFVPPRPFKILNRLKLLLWSKQKEQKNSYPTKSGFQIQRSEFSSTFNVAAVPWTWPPGGHNEVDTPVLASARPCFSSFSPEWKWAWVIFQGLSELKLSMQHTAPQGSSEQSHRLMGESLFCRKLFSVSAWLRQRPPHL